MDSPGSTDAEGSVCLWKVSTESTPLTLHFHCVSWSFGRDLYVTGEGIVLESEWTGLAKLHRAAR